ncbi:MAG: hypothetical protein GXP54_11195 [Deltaproteobacteria bacterium]|nr:hypothetical protein [Deltaproteobacteria bacterium]
MGTADRKNVFPVSIETFAALLKEVGYDHYHVDEEGGRISLDIKGDETRLRLQVNEGRAPNGEVWYTRMIAYSLDFEPISAGMDKTVLLQWLNLKNSDLLFGRYYFDEKTDTVAYEIAVPCNGGIHGADFLDMLRIATVTVDRTHVELAALTAKTLQN